MWKYVVGVDGMMCSMCEAHVNDAIRKQFDVKKVTASHKKNQVEILMEEELDESKLKEVLSNLGYDLKEVHKESVKKKGLFGLF